MFRFAVVRQLLLSMALLSGIGSARAGIEVPTRVVFHGQSQDMTLPLRNPGNKPSLIQVWLDPGDPDRPPEETQVPFLLTPALVRIEPAGNHRLRILALPDVAQLPQDRETRYFLNLLDIPPKPAHDESGAAGSTLDLNLAVHYRMPFLYRPAPLEPAADSDSKSRLELLPRAAAQVRWSIVQRDGAWLLEARNPTPYSLSLREVSTGPTGIELAATGGELLPMSTTTYSLQSTPAQPTHGPGWSVHYLVADDGGYSVPGQAPLH